LERFGKRRGAFCCSSASSLNFQFHHWRTTRKPCGFANFYHQSSNHCIDRFPRSVRICFEKVLTKSLVFIHVDLPFASLRMHVCFRSQTKLKILAKNPAIYQTFREGLVEKHYTHWGVSYSLQHFLDNNLRLPELKEEILTHPLNRCWGTPRLFGYLGSSSPTLSTKQIRSKSVSPPTKSKSANTASSFVMVDALTLPSFEKTDQISSGLVIVDTSTLPSLEKTDHSDDESDDGIISVDGIHEFL